MDCCECVGGEEVFLLVLRLWMGLCLVCEWIMVCVFEVGYGFGVLFLDGV